MLNEYLAMFLIFMLGYGAGAASLVLYIWSKDTQFRELRTRKNKRRLLGALAALSIGFGVVHSLNSDFWTGVVVVFVGIALLYVRRKIAQT